jgi:hypothetical protein
MEHREIVWEGVDWIHQTQDKDLYVAGYCEHSNEPLDFIIGG